MLCGVCIVNWCRVCTGNVYSLLHKVRGVFHDLNNLVGFRLVRINNLAVWKSASSTACQSGSLAVVVRGIDGIGRSNVAVVAIGIY